MVGLRQESKGWERAKDAVAEKGQKEPDELTALDDK